MLPMQCLPQSHRGPRDSQCDPAQSARLCVLRASVVQSSLRWDSNRANPDADRARTPRVHLVGGVLLCKVFCINDLRALKPLRVRAETFARAAIMRGQEGGVGLMFLPIEAEGVESVETSFSLRGSLPRRAVLGNAVLGINGHGKFAAPKLQFLGSALCEQEYGCCD